SDANVLVISAQVSNSQPIVVTSPDPRYQPRPSRSSLSHTCADCVATVLACLMAKFQDGGSRFSAASTNNLNPSTPPANMIASNPVACPRFSVTVPLSACRFPILDRSFVGQQPKSSSAFPLCSSILAGSLCVLKVSDKTESGPASGSKATF